MVQVAVGEPGWAGNKLALRRYDSDGNATLVATVELSEAGVVTCDDPRLLAEWEQEGVCGVAGDRQEKQCGAK